MTKPPLPSAGGSYTRDAKGNLKPAKPAKSPKSAKSGEKNAPVKEA